MYDTYALTSVFIYYLFNSAPEMLYEFAAFVADPNCDDTLVDEKLFKRKFPPLTNFQFPIESLFPKFFKDMAKLLPSQQYRVIGEAILYIYTFAEMDRKYNTFLFYLPFCLSLLSEPTKYTQVFACWLLNRIQRTKIVLVYPDDQPELAYLVTLLDLANPVDRISDDCLCHLGLLNCVEELKILSQITYTGKHVNSSFYI